MAQVFMASVCVCVCVQNKKGLYTFDYFQVCVSEG